MKNVNYKKLILPNIPYVFIGLLATKLGQAARLSPGVDFSSKALNIMQGISMAFENIMPSFHPIDLLVGIAAGVIIRLVVYFKGKNAKKFRKNLEYGSARWGTREDIAPFMDPVFENNIILTQTESLMMSNRPKEPKNARNKNVLVIGGSGSVICPELCGQHKKNPYGKKYQILSSKLASFFERSQFCFCLDPLVVVETDKLSNEEASLLKSFQFYTVNALSFENREKIFRHCVVIRVPFT